jgi:hypothetical protein
MKNWLYIVILIGIVLFLAHNIFGTYDKRETVEYQAQLLKLESVYDQLSDAHPGAIRTDTMGYKSMRHTYDYQLLADRLDKVIVKGRFINVVRVDGGYRGEISTRITSLVTCYVDMDEMPEEISNEFIRQWILVITIDSVVFNPEGEESYTGRLLDWAEIP